MKIALVKYGGFPSQGDTEFYEIANGFKEIGNTVYVIIPRRFNESKCEDRGNLQIVRTYRIRSIHPFINLLLFYINSSFVIRKLRPDVVQATNSLGISILLISTIKKSAANWLFYVTTGAIKKGILSNIMNIVSEFESRVFDKILITESHQKRLFRKTNPEKLSLVPFGVNLNLFRPGLCSNKFIHKKSSEETWFVYHGSMAKIRSLDILIKAFDEAHSIAPNARLLLAGPVESYVVNSIKQSSCESAIKLIGPIPYQLMPTVLGCCDVGLSWVPNIDVLMYNPPFKAMEFLACGLPVLATNTYGNRLFVKDGFNGVIAKSEAKSYGQAIAFLINNKSLRKQLAANARSSIEYYGWETVIKAKLIPILNEDSR